MGRMAREGWGSERQLRRDRGWAINDEEWKCRRRGGGDGDGGFATPPPVYGPRDEEWEGEGGESGHGIGDGDSDSDSGVNREMTPPRLKCDVDDDGEEVIFGKVWIVAGI